MRRKVLENRYRTTYDRDVTLPRPTPEPVEMHARAMDNLLYIRRTMERAGSFTAVPGRGGILIGCTALAASGLAASKAGSRAWLAIWVAEAALALLIGIAAAARKSKRANLALFSGPGRKFLAGFAPAMAAGALLTGVLFRNGAFGILPGVWLLLYGASVVSGGAASVRIVPLMGGCFMAAGAAALLLPGSWGNLVLGIAFGGFHILFGLVISVKYGG